MTPNRALLLILLVMIIWALGAPLHIISIIDLRNGEIALCILAGILAAYFRQQERGESDD